MLVGEGGGEGAGRKLSCGGGEGVGQWWYGDDAGMLAREVMVQ